MLVAGSLACAGSIVQALPIAETLHYSMFALHSRRIEERPPNLPRGSALPLLWAKSGIVVCCIQSWPGPAVPHAVLSRRVSRTRPAVRHAMPTLRSAAWLILVAHNCCIENRIIAIGGRDLRPRMPSSHATCFARAPQSDMRPRHSTAWVIFDQSPLLHRQPPPCHPKPGPPHAVLSRHVSRPGAAV